MAEWLVERDVAEVVMESTAQYWRPVWEALERYWQPRRARDGAVAQILHERVRYEERGPAVSAQATQIRTRKMIRALRGLGYRVELPSPTNGE